MLFQQKLFIPNRIYLHKYLCACVLPADSSLIRIYNLLDGTVYIYVNTHICLVDFSSSMFVPYLVRNAPKYVTESTFSVVHTSHYCNSDYTYCDVYDLLKAQFPSIPAACSVNKQPENLMVAAVSELRNTKIAYFC
jgi:hypothetical protein